MKKVASWNRPTNAAKKHYHGANSVLRSHHVRWTCPSALPRVPLQEVQNHTLPSRHVHSTVIVGFHLKLCPQWILDLTTSNITKHHQNIIFRIFHRTEFSWTHLLRNSDPRCRGSIRRANWWRHQLDTQRKDISSKHCSSEASELFFWWKIVSIFLFIQWRIHMLHIILYVFGIFIYLHVA